ncbi:YvrJ family protein [Anoxybacteroides tepidamans]|nr:YvrJ family protein [Anoxybacillus tepidamans]
METYLSLISDVGFPAVITFYLLYRIEAKLDGIIESIERLPQQLLKN